MVCADYDGVLFVGMSQNRASRKREPPPVAQRHDSLLAGVAAIDERTGQVLGLLEFASGVTEVYDVQALPGIRRAGMQNLLATDGSSVLKRPIRCSGANGPTTTPSTCSMYLAPATMA